MPRNLRNKSKKKKNENSNAIYLNTEIFQAKNESFFHRIKLWYNLLSEVKS